MSRHVTETPLRVYTLSLFGPGGLDLGAAYGFTMIWQQWLRETEENLTDLLPEGYEVRIREWDDDDER